MPGKGIPSINWKVFFDKNEVTHLGPAIENKLMSGHRLDMTCPCNPNTDQGKPIIIVHYVIH